MRTQTGVLNLLDDGINLLARRARFHDDNHALAPDENSHSGFSLSAATSTTPDRTQSAECRTQTTRDIIFPRAAFCHLRSCKPHTKTPHKKQTPLTPSRGREVLETPAVPPGFRPSTAELKSWKVGGLDSTLQLSTIPLQFGPALVTPELRWRTGATYYSE